MYAPMLDFYAKMAAADQHYVTLDNHKFAIASHTEIKRGRSAIMYTQNWSYKWPPYMLIKL